LKYILANRTLHGIKNPIITACLRHMMGIAFDTLVAGMKTLFFVRLQNSW